ncbi:hypothetical protein HC251_11155 [Iamia sp. SCSIO 61187]|uniref:hypothetical protein n=1 Tax=Iamia sp. SCSIO 61187 TaxID=2722752 RepID=UPI001C625F8F|nr:hypothetical protein [Iamia sp. SCSIO 61187]QYG92932.1 hypothetical protein HC251_11155 [Iamia sp. SCSIO 61187]
MSPTTTPDARPGTRRQARAAARRPDSTPAAPEAGATEAGAPEAGDGPDRTSPSSPGAPRRGAAAPARSRAAARPVPSVATVWKVLAVLGVLGTIGFGLAWRAADSRAATEDGLAPEVVEMRTEAREFGIALTNFDAATIDADFDRILDFATGDFAEEADRFYDEEIRAQLRDAQATSRSEIRDIYVQGFSGDRGVVFFVADQTVANNRSPQPITDTLRVELTMVRVDGEWKVQTVEVLDAPPGAQLQGADLGAEGGAGGEPPAPTTTAPG